MDRLDFGLDLTLRPELGPLIKRAWKIPINIWAKKLGPWPGLLSRWKLSQRSRNLSPSLSHRQKIGQRGPHTKAHTRYRVRNDAALSTTSANRISTSKFINEASSFSGCVRWKERWLASPLTGMGMAFRLSCQIQIEWRFNILK